ncbi:MAG: hypothetical protein JNL75_10430 [Chitinophagales bacterium]|nr:hypothetical protein [Chitinophagales bacterium]
MKTLLEYYAVVSGFIIIVLVAAILILLIILLIVFLTSNEKAKLSFILKLLVYSISALTLLGGSCLVLFETGVLSLH